MVVPGFDTSKGSGGKTEIPSLSRERGENGTFRIGSIKEKPRAKSKKNYISLPVEPRRRETQ